MSKGLDINSEFCADLDIIRIISENENRSVHKCMDCGKTVGEDDHLKICTSCSDHCRGLAKAKSEAT